MFRQLSTIGYLFHFPSSYSLPLTLALGCWRIRIPPLAAYQMTLYKIYPVNIRSGESRIRRKRNRQQPGGGGGGESLKLLAKGWLQWLQEGDRRAEREGSYMNNARRRFVGLWGLGPVEYLREAIFELWRYRSGIVDNGTTESFGKRLAPPLDCYVLITK